MNLIYNFSSAEQNRPSFFELLMETQLMPSLKPALKYMLMTLSQRSSGLTWAVKWSDEIYTLLLFLLERHHLNNYDASFAENFYGLKRTVVSEDGKKLLPLTASRRRVALFFLVIFPYLKEKVDAFYVSRFRSHRRHNVPNSPLKRMALEMFRIFYPFFIALWESWFFIYQLLYMYGYSIHYTPLLFLQGLTVKRLTMGDLVEQSQKTITNQIKLKRRSGLFARTKDTVFSAIGTTLDWARYTLPLAIFFFKFLEWWYSENRLTTSNLPAPPPPPPSRQSIGGLPIDTSNLSVCPICKKKRENPAASSSGHVYCYMCLFDYVQLHKRCPTTHLPMSDSDIRKLYDD